MLETTTLVNHFLIAMPSMGDPNFSRTVTYLCQHSNEGAMGIVINRPSNIHLGEMMKQMDIQIKNSTISELPIFYGGPVQPERGFVLHEMQGQWNSTLQVAEGIALTTSRDILEAIALGEGPNKLIVALGYAGWGEGQIEREIRENAWLNSPAQNSILFDTPVHQRWKLAAEQMGINIDLLSTQAGHC